MGIVYQTDKRSGITYAYENKSFWDKEKKQSRSKRSLIGRVDDKTGEIIPTDGRCRRRSPNYIPSNNEYIMPKTMKGLKDEIHRLLTENEALRDEINRLKRRIEPR